MIILIIYLLGVIACYGVVNYIFTTREEPRSILVFEEHFSRWPNIWYVDFEKEWEYVLDKRRGYYLHLAIMCIGSWSGLFGVWIAHGKVVKKMRWRIPPSPNKEAFRLIVEAQRLSDPRWGSLTHEEIKNIFAK